METSKLGKATTSPTILRKLSIFLDGLSRVSIIPYAPNLIYSILFQGKLDSNEASNWSKLIYHVVFTVSLYSFGRWLGASVAERKPIDHSKLTSFVARIAGISLTLFVFSFGTAATSTWWLFILRLVSGFLVGYLCQITNGRLFDDRYAEEYDEESGNSFQRYDISVRASDFSFPFGLSISLFLGGGLFNLSRKSSKFRALAGGDLFPLSPMFFVFISVIGDACFRIIIWYAGGFDNGTYHEKEIASLATPPQDSKKSSKSRTRYKNFENNFEPDNGSQSFSFGTNRIRALSEASQRSRLTSGGSAEFFDCQSFDDLAESDGTGNIEKVKSPNDTARNKDRNNKSDEYRDHSNNDIVQYRENKCVYSDGSPAFVPQGHCEVGIPDTFLYCCNGNESKARDMWMKMKKWRQESHVWRIHTIPQPFFSRIKEAYPHFIHGYSKIGNPVLYEKPGKMNLKKLFRSGCSIDDMVQHYVFCNEFVSNVVCLKEEISKLRGGKPHSYDTWKNLIIMDVTGISISHLSGDVIKYLARAGDINNKYYPDSMARVLVVNAPFWLAGAWSGIKGVFPESITVDILSPSKTLKGMKKYIDDDQIPQEYGGSSSFQEGEHPFEIELKELVKNADKKEDLDSSPEVAKLGTEKKSFTSDSLNYISQHSQQEKVVFNEDDIKICSTVGFPVQGSNEKSALIDQENTEMSELFGVDDGKNINEQRTILRVISKMLILWYLIQGALECAIPMWILCPSILGGLGYTPLQCRFFFLCISLFFLLFTGTKFAHSMLTVHKKYSLNVLRVSVGSELILLLILPVIPNAVVSVPRNESIMAMASITILITLLVLVITIGSTSISSLHRLAFIKYSDSFKQSSCMLKWYGYKRFQSDCKTGKLTSNLEAFAGMAGNLVIAPVHLWSISKARLPFFDSAFSLMLASFALLVFHALSFTLRLNTKGELVVPAFRGVSSFIYDMIAIPVCDIFSHIRKKG